MANTTFTATTEIKEGLQVVCRARDFEFILDEPVSLGGTDTGMNPVEALLSALGACKCIVARAFAEQQGITLRNVRIELDGVLDPDGFLGQNPQAKVGFSEVTSHYHFDADNTREELEAFIEYIEAHCPVQDTLTNPATYRSVLH